MAWPAPSWNIVNRTLSKKFRWQWNKNTKNSIEENAFENVSCKMAAILPRPQCVNYYLQSHHETAVLVSIGDEACLWEPWTTLNRNGQNFEHLLTKTKYHFLINNCGCSPVKKIIYKELRAWIPPCCALLWWRHHDGTTEEGNCCYLLPARPRPDQRGTNTGQMHSSHGWNRMIFRV